ncbi:MAG: S-layer homology domain-containing protein [Leptolyngbyaceae cyanobacterium]
MAQQVLYVDAEKGQDNRDGRSPNQPLKTITAALRLSQGDTQVQLQAGLYTANSGEQFPLVIPSGCELVGQAGGGRPTTIIQGSGPVQHPVLGRQVAASVLQDGAKLQQVTVINTQAQGIGLLLAEGRPQLSGVVVMKCPQYGAVTLGKALPLVQDCVFENCGTAIAWFTQSKGQFERVFCQNNQTALRIEDSAAPLILSCGLERNVTGVAIADTANPVLRNNRIRQNQTVGLTLTGQATADFGQAEDLGNNIVRLNGAMDIQNGSGRSLVSCGNDVLPQRIQGRVDLIASALPDAAAVPPVLFEQPTSWASSEPVEPDDADATESLPMPRGSVQFSDMAQHWAGPFVDALAQAGAVAGFTDGTFRPERSVTRAEFAAFIVASFPNLPEPNAPQRFTDVSPNFWAYTALSQAQRMGFLSGFPDDTLRPSEPITRIQAIVAVANGLQLTGGRVDDVGIYRDRAQIPSYAVDALSTAPRQRLVVNYPDPLLLRPLETMTRGEVSALIYQGRVAVGASPAIASPYIVRPDTTQPLFSDLTAHWASDFIQGLAAVNLVNGLQDGRFAPDNAITRAEFATLVVAAFQPVPIKAAMQFKDVPSDYWAASAIQQAYRGEFMAGFPDLTFAPEHPLLRVQTWVALVNGLDWATLPTDEQVLSPFTDALTLPRYGLQQTAVAVVQHLIANYPDRQALRPNQVTTRAEACVAIYQALVALQRLPAIASEYVV